MTPEMYTGLMNLVSEDEAFFFKDFILEDVCYRIFNYRLASWSSFQKPWAKWCRGTMFDITDESNVRLVSLPPMKFFNWGEGNVDHTTATCMHQMEKLDGSLISTYVHKGKLYLKTKGSISSEQAIDAMNWLNKPENSSFKTHLFLLAIDDSTVNLELTSAKNRVVVPYFEERLSVLNVIVHDTKMTFSGDRLHLWFAPKYLVVHKNRNWTGESLTKAVAEMETETVGEGYVLVMRPPEGYEHDYMVKIKNHRYCQLHLTKDSITTPARLFECVIDESTDDLRTMFETDPVALRMIQEMEDKVMPIFNHLIKRVEDFVTENNGLDRKSYAIKAKSDAPDIMGLLMTAYLGNQVDYKHHAKKYRKELFGIGDAKTTVED